MKTLCLAFGTLLLLISCCANEANGQTVASLFAGGFKADGLTIGFHAGLENPPAVALKVESVYTGYERKGFYRIGILPMAILEGVAIQVHHPEFVTNSLAELQTWLGSREAKRLEMRQVSIAVGQGDTNHVQCGRVRIISAGRWELLDGVQWCSGTNRLAARRATLQVAGPRTGELILATQPPRTNNLFTSTEFKITHQKDEP